jgi:nickel/cobalt exporter
MPLKTVARRTVVTVSIVASLLVLAIVAGAPEAAAQMGPFGGPRPPAADGLTGWILAQQAHFYRALAGTLRAARSDGTALWGLMGISFLYGIFHAAGPGHGKAVISSYLLANEETWRRGVALSFASALLQALTAVAIVGIAAVLLGATAKMMGDTVRIIELVSYGLIVLLGARLLWVKGRGFVAALHDLKDKGASPSALHHHQHRHEHAHAPAACTHHGHAHGHNHAPAHHHAHAHEEAGDVLPWGHAHGPEPVELAGAGGWRRGLSAIVAVGLRPCSGAILVLVFALAQGLFWAGVASTFVMGLGTAITVAAIATLAVGAKGLAKRFATRRSGYGSLVLRGVEVGASALVLVFGVLLLAGYMASERMIGF